MTNNRRDIFCEKNSYGKVVKVLKKYEDMTIEEIEKKMEEEMYDAIDEAERPNPFYFKQTGYIEENDPYESNDWHAEIAEYGYELGMNDKINGLTTNPETIEIEITPEMMESFENDYCDDEIDYLEEIDNIPDDEFEIENMVNSLDDSEIEKILNERPIDPSEEPQIEEPIEEKIEAEIIKKRYKE